MQGNGVIDSSGRGLPGANDLLGLEL
jgi:hypothetical protein